MEHIFALLYWEKRFPLAALSWTAAVGVQQMTIPVLMSAMMAPMIPKIGQEIAPHQYAGFTKLKKLRTLMMPNTMRGMLMHLALFTSGIRFGLLHMGMVWGYPEADEHRLRRRRRKRRLNQALC